MSETLTTKQILECEEKVTVFIPRAEGDKRNYMAVTINDITFQIRLEEYVEVPRSVAQAIGDVKSAAARCRRQLDEDIRRMKEIANAAGGKLY